MCEPYCSLARLPESYSRLISVDQRHSLLTMSAGAAHAHVATDEVKNPCLICHESLTTGRLPIGCFDCGHYFHEPCWAQWQATNLLDERPTLCPQCRAPQSMLIRSFLEFGDPTAAAVAEGAAAVLEDLDKNQRAALIIGERLWTDSAAQVLQHLSFLDKCRVPLERMIGMGAVVALVRCIGRLIDEPLVVTNATRILKDIAVTSEVPSCILTRTSGSAEVLVSVLNQYRAVPYLRGRCSYLLTCGICIKPDWLGLSASGVVRAVTRSLVKCSAETCRDMSRSINLLDYIAEAYDWSDVFSDPDLIPALVHALTHGNATVVSAVCRLLGGMLSYPRFRRRFVKKKGVAALGEALSRHITNPHVTHEVYRLLGKLAIQSLSLDA